MSAALQFLLIALYLVLAGAARADDWSAWQRAYDPATRTRFIPVELWTGAPWDGTQEIPPLDPDDVLEALTDDLMNFGDLQHAMRNLLQRGMRDNTGNRLQGLRYLLQQLRQQRRNTLDRFNLDSDFAQRGIELRFLKSEAIEYAQFGHPFVPRLSIVDLMMFNPPERVDAWIRSRTYSEFVTRDQAIAASPSGPSGEDQP